LVREQAAQFQGLLLTTRLLLSMLQERNDPLAQPGHDPLPDKRLLALQPRRDPRELARRTAALAARRAQDGWQE
jgi:hypothetical protein